MRTKFFILFITLLAFTFSQAEIHVSSILGDNMVLQRKNEVKIWGTAKPNQKLNITTSWNNVLSNCTCNEKGEWLIKLPQCIYCRVTWTAFPKSNGEFNLGVYFKVYVK